MKEQFEKFMAECPAVAILRGITNAEVTAVCDALYEAGIRLLEIPLNSPDAVKSIAIASEHCKKRMAVGAGTVLTVEDVNNVHKAGGTFIISPNTDTDVIKETKKLGMLSIPGFFTASEGFAAIKAGADYLKLFPACLGPSYVKDLKAVIKTPIMAVGGVNSNNIPDFMKVCCGVGIGSALYKAGKSLADIRQDAEEIVKAVKG
ncbi:MAG: 2-dehydro-3-deoxy-6-phosphogalactonate aldolase [Lentisphaeria bacterium]|nr:2-dehydro-3-deoxy-6-phosphogalactonate aldolase [Lentisphaeria bacterium]